MDSGSKTGLTLLAVGMLAVVTLMVKLRGHTLFEVGLCVFLLLQLINAVLILRAHRRSEPRP